MDPAQAFEAREIARHAIVNETIARFDSPVQRFYEGGVVFITGASGFLGKQLVEKLFRSCKIAKIYVLLRTKKKKTCEDRIQDLIRDPVYECLKEKESHFWKKIVAVQGDVSEIGLGLSEKERSCITEEVTMIFHCAATINFEESLKKATLTNVRGTRELIQLAKDCKKLKSYVHVSTAYAHATTSRVGKDVLEEFYRSPISPEALIELVETLDEDQLNAMTSQLIKNWPNTYAFTKAVAEEAVRTTSGDLPICILRPAIVIAALREPKPGWIDPSCAFGPSGMFIGSALGVVHVVHCNDEVKMDLVPVDVVNNAVLVAAHETAARRKRSEAGVKIYTVTSTRNITTFGDLCYKFGNESKVKYGTDKCIMLAACLKTSNWYKYYILSWIFHYIPAYAVDGVLAVLGKKPLNKNLYRFRFMKIYNKIEKLSGVFSFYMFCDWRFGDTNLRELYWKLSPTDRLIFDCNTDSVHWTHYLNVWSIGIRKYILKDGLNRTNVGLRKQIIFTLLMFIILFPLCLYGLYNFILFCGYVIIMYVFSYV